MKYYMFRQLRPDLVLCMRKRYFVRSDRRKAENYPIDPNNQSKNLEPLTSLSFIQPN